MKQLRKFKLLIDNYLYDLKRFWHYSSAIKPIKELVQLEAKIDARYHNIEKGLTFSEVKLGFGKEKIELLLGFLDQYQQSGFDQSRRSFQTALSVLAEYIKYHEEQNFNVDWLKKKVRKYTYKHKFSGGTKEVSRFDLVSKQNGNFKDLAFNRHSIRNFSSEKVELSQIREAVAIAQMSPSVCNRQSSLVHIVNDETLKKKTLEIHKGNSGFGHLASSLLIVTSDMRTFTGIGERNQCYIDGSLFGMTLTYALHSLGLATCIMNWSVTKGTDISLHALLKIPDHEVIMFIIAVGHYPEKLLVAKSIRKNLEDIITIH